MKTNNMTFRNYSTSKGYSKKDLTSNSSEAWDYKNENDVETSFFNTDEDFFSNDNDDDDMDCVFFN